MDIIEFADENNIKWFPLNVKVTNGGKIPSYPKEYNAKPDQNDFKNLDVMDILERQEHIDKCNCIALDTSEITIIDVDFEDDIDYQKDYPDAYEYVETLIKNGIAYKKSNTKKKGKHFFITTDYKFNGVRTQTKFKHIELLTGQWAFSPKDRKVRNNTIGFFDLKDIVEQAQQRQSKKQTKIKIKRSKAKSESTINNITENKEMNKDIKKYADLINLEYLDDYDSWTKIIWSLANDDEDHFEIAKYISMKSEKYNEDSLIKLWNKTRGGSTMGTFYYYCKLSNPDKYLLLKAMDCKHTFCLDDDSIAEVFFEEFKDNLIYKNEILYVFNDKTNLWYEDRKLLKIKYFIGKVVKEYYLKVNVELSKKAYNEVNEFENNYEKQMIIEDLKIIGKILDKMGTASKKKNVAECLLHILSVRDFDNIEFDANGHILPFTSNVYDLQKHEFRKPVRSDYILTTIPYILNERDDEKIQLLEELFNKIFPDQEIKDTYFSFLVTALYGQPVEKFIIANGGGGNGKGLVNELFEEMLSSNFCYRCSNAVLLQPLKEGINTQVANMNNKRMIIYSEPDSTTKKINGSTMKELTGGKGISAERKYSMDNKVVLKATHFLEANNKPKIDGRIDDSYTRRLVDIPFVSTFTSDQSLLNDPDRINTFSKDTTYKTDEWREEYKHQLFYYLIDHSKKYKSIHGYDCIKKVNVCEEVINRTKTYLEHSDEKFTWFRNTYEKSEGHILKIKDIYDLYKCSDLYLNMSKKEKREESYKNFIVYIKGNVNFRSYFRERHRPIVNGERIEKKYNGRLEIKSCRIRKRYRR